MAGPGLTRHALRLVLALFPPDFRRRHRRDVEALLDETSREEPDPRRRAALERRALRDALHTLPAAWWHAVASGRRDAPPWRSRLAQDAAFAVRHLRRRPLRSATMVATLAFALGSATAIASVSHAILLRALPYGDPGRVVAVEPPAASFTSRGPRLTEGFVEAPEVDHAALYIPDGAAALATGDGSPARRIATAQVSEGFFRTLGVTPAVGRDLSPAGDAVDEVILSHGLWRSSFGADPGIVGREIRLNDHPVTVVGVAPPEVRFPGSTEAWLPLPPLGELYGGAYGLFTVARLHTGASPVTLRARLQEMEDAQWADVPEERRRVRTVTVRPMREELTRGLRTPLVLLAVAAGSVLALACLNLACIELAGISARRRELRVRSALGASRRRLVAQLFTEALVLSAAGGAGGLLLAMGGIALLKTLLPGETAGLEAAGLSLPALAAAGALTLVAGMLIGVLPAWRARGVAGLGAGRQASSGLEGRRLQSALVVAQVALAVTLAAGAGLLGRSLARLHAVPLGYDTEGVLTFEVRFPDARLDERASYLAAARERLRALPGVTGVGASSRLPLGGGMGVGARIRPAGQEDGELRRMIWVAATDGWLDAMGVRRLAGRDLPAAFGPEPGVVLSRSLADSLFGPGPALGRWVEHGFGELSEPVPVVGVVDDVVFVGAPATPRPTLYTPYSHESSFGFALRTTGDPDDLAAPARAALQGVDPSIPAHSFASTGSTLALHLAARSAVVRLSSLFGLVAIVLASLGLYGLVARTVLSRRRELGVRLALGASPRRLMGRTVLEGAMLAAIGASLGLAAFLPLATRLEELLYEVDAREPRVLVPVVVAVLAVAVLATWIPARATTRLDPRESLTADG